MRAHSMFDTRTKARSLAFLFAAEALTCLLTVLLPHVEPVQERSVLVLAGLSLALALVFLRFAGRISEALVHVSLAAVTVMLSLVIHYTHDTTLYALIYMWPALFAFYFFSTPTALGHLAFIVAAYATVLRIDGTMDATIRLVLVLGTPLVVGLLIARLLGLMREAIERSARQERALRSSERRTRLIVDSARDGFISADAQGRVLDVNAAAERLLGRSREEAIGRPFQELGIPPESHALFIQRRRNLLTAAREGGTRHLAMRVTIDRPDGTQLRGETMIWVVERDGELMFNARLTDIGDRLREERKREQLVRAEAARAEAERAAATIGRLQAVADAALTVRDLDQLGPTILARTREVLDAEAAALLLVQDDGSVSLISSDPVVATDRPDRIAPDVGIAGRVLATGRPVLVNDPPAEQLADPSILDAGISSMLGVPLVAHQEVIGVIEVGVRAPRRLGPDDVDLLRLTADRVALAIDHVRAYRREHRIAETLQRSLLPLTLPSL
ncbi:MAG: GAF domain-containing protein, partial [Solirubrobacteraceae bacterium]